jgi:HlyD family secretion protein
MKKALPFLLVAVLIVAAVGGFLAYRRSQAARSNDDLQTQTAARGTLVASVGATGMVRANQTAILAWQTTGTVEEVNAKTGDSVGEGDLLASLKQTSLPQTVIMAQGELISAQQSLDDLLNSQLPYAQALQAVEDAQNAIETYQASLSSRQAEAYVALQAAEDALEKAEKARNNMNYGRADDETIQAAEDRYNDAVNQVEELENLVGEFGGTEAQAALTMARRARDKALDMLNWYKSDWSEEEISTSDANLQQAQAALELAQHEYDRLVGTEDSAELALLEAQLADAERNFESLQDGPPENEVNALLARIAAAEATISSAQLAAPFAGTVTTINMMTGDQVAPGATVIRIDDLSHLMVDVSVSEVDINRVQVGQNVSLTFDAINGKTYTGVVSDVAVVGTVVQGVVEFDVTVELTDADAMVRPGMTAAVNIVVEEKENVLLVPNRAVRVVEGQRVVYILKEDQVERVNLELGASSDTDSEVIGGGLKEGDQIIFNPPIEFSNMGPGFMR